MKSLGRRSPPSIMFAPALSASFPPFSRGPTRNLLQQNKLFFGSALATSPRSRRSPLGTGKSPSKYLIPCGASFSLAARRWKASAYRLETKGFLQSLRFLIFTFFVNSILLVPRGTSLFHDSALQSLPST